MFCLNICITFKKMLVKVMETFPVSWEEICISIISNQLVFVPTVDSIAEYLCF